MRTVKSYTTSPPTREPKFRQRQRDSRLRGKGKEKIYSETITFGQFLREVASTAVLILAAGLGVLALLFALIVLFARFH